MQASSSERRKCSNQYRCPSIFAFWRDFTGAVSAQRRGIPVIKHVPYPFMPLLFLPRHLHLPDRPALDTPLTTQAG